MAKEDHCFLLLFFFGGWSLLKKKKRLSELSALNGCVKGKQKTTKRSNSSWNSAEPGVESRAEREHGGHETGRELLNVLLSSWNNNKLPRSDNFLILLPAAAAAKPAA